MEETRRQMLYKLLTSMGYNTEKASDEELEVMFEDMRYNKAEHIKQNLSWKCPICNKFITSLYTTQFDYNKTQHQDYHKRRGDKEVQLK